MNCAAGEKHRAPIHREAPTFVEQSTGQEILATGIKASSLVSGMQCHTAAQLLDKPPTAMGEAAL